MNRRIVALGGVDAGQRGSHRKYRAAYMHADATVGVAQTIVAQHRGDMSIGTLRAIERLMEPALGKGWLL